MDSLEEVSSDGAEDREIETVQSSVTEEYIIATISAYCNENYPHICNDGDSTYTATGTIATAGRTVAVDPKFISYGTKIEIEGVGVRIAEDCGGAIKGENKIDLLVETHQEALNFGRQTKEVTIIN